MGHDIATICIHSTTTNQLFDNFGYVRAIYNSMMKMLLLERGIKSSNGMFWMKPQNIPLNIEPNQRKCIIVNQRVQIWQK